MARYRLAVAAAVAAGKVEATLPEVLEEQVVGQPGRLPLAAVLAAKQATRLTMPRAPLAQRGPAHLPWVAVVAVVAVLVLGVHTTPGSLAALVLFPVLAAVVAAAVTRVIAAATAAAALQAVWRCIGNGQQICSC
ncbi:MAG: hypothetical protein AB1609_18795 [Bacillota bacterium]